MSKRLTVAEAVGRTVARLGAAHAFGVVGSGNFHLTNAMVGSGVPFTAARHEMGATCMADAFSRTSGAVAVVSVHQGPGLTNALTGIGEAAKCHSRVLVVAGDTAVGDLVSNFRIDQDAVVAGLGAVPERVHSARTAVADVARAYRRVALGRATVVLSVPIDIQEELIEWDAAMVPMIPERTAPGPSPISADRLATMLVDAERPVIVAGRGARHAGEALRRLGDLSGAVLTTSAAARGLFVGDEWALDIMGGFATEGAAEIIADADLLVAFGAGLNRWTTRGGALLHGKTVVQVDDHAEAFGRHCLVDLEVLGDSAVVAAAVADLVESRRPTGRGYRRPEIAAAIRSVRYWSDQPVDSRAESDRVDPRELTNALDALLPMARIVVPDGGNFNCYPGAHLRVPDERGYCLPQSYQSIGLALSSAIGAALALPGRLPIAGVGDGGFLMSLVELDTAVRLGLGVLVVIYDDNAYGAEVHHYEQETQELSTVTFPDTDLAAIARGYGCEAVTIRGLDDLRPVRDWLDGPRDRPLVFDAKVARFASWVLEHAHGRDAVPAGAVR